MKRKNIQVLIIGVLTNCLAVHLMYAAFAELATSSDVTSVKTFEADAVDISKGRPWLPAQTPLTEEQKKKLEAFTKVFRVPDIVPNGKGIKAETLTAFQNKVRQEYGIHWDGAVLRGKPIFSYAQLGDGKPPKKEGEPVVRTGPGTEKRKTGAGVEMFDIISTISDITKAYGQATQEQAVELKRLYLDLCRHILNQGMVEGVQHNDTDRADRMFYLNSGPGYAWAGKSAAILSMRSALAETGLLLPMTRAVAWWLNSDWLDKTNREYNTDYWVQGRWQDLDRSIAAMPDSPEKWQRLMAMMRYFSSNIVNGGGFSLAGEFQHHGGFHLAYSYAMGTMLRDAVALHKAGLELSPEARQYLRAYGRTTAWLLMDGVYAANLTMRSGGPEGRKNIAGELRMLADLGELDGSEPIDREMAALYSACAPADAKDKIPGVTATKLEGAMTLPMRPALIWRTPDTLVSVAGMRSDFPGYEVYTWTQSNIQCRYPLNGSVMVMKRDGKTPTPGYEPEKGWDWSLWPGVTSLIENDVALTPRGGYFGGKNISPSGGVCVLGDAVPSAINLQEGRDASGFFILDMKTPHVNFRKSVFAVGGHVLVQTSGINSTYKEPCVTTLYHDYLERPTQPSVLDGETMSAVPVAKGISMSQSHALTDAVGMNYQVLPVPGMAQQPVLRVVRRHQSWRLPYDKFIKPDYPKPLHPF
ncbi:MAG: chondroitinase family polysaccharide lyase, partial [Victivallales bacterium]